MSTSKPQGSRLYNKNMQEAGREVMQDHDSVNARNIGKREAQHRKHKRLKLGYGHAYDSSIV